MDVLKKLMHDIARFVQHLVEIVKYLPIKTYDFFDFFIEHFDEDEQIPELFAAL